MSPGIRMGTTESLVDGRYAVGAPLGRGGMSNVYEAWDEAVGRRVALKRLRFPSPTAKRRYQREARLLARLRHPGIAEIYEVGDDYLAMEFVQGRPLQEVIAERAPLPVAWVAALGTQIAAVLASAHRVNLVHRDIKPSNILLTPSGAVRVVDFGMSTLVGGETLSTLTPPGVSVGSEGYLAPECQDGVAGPHSDIYSLGVVLRDLGASTDFGMTSYSPNDRPASALAVVTLLEPLLGPLSPLPPFVSSPEEVPALTASYVDHASAVVALPPRPARAEASGWSPTDGPQTRSPCSTPASRHSQPITRCSWTCAETGSASSSRSVTPTAPPPKPRP